MSHFASQFKALSQATLHHKFIRPMPLGAVLIQFRQQLAAAPAAHQDLALLAREHFDYTSGLIHRMRPAYRHSITPLPPGNGWLKDLWLNLTPQSATFRYSLRYACCMAVGYQLGLLLNVENSYWIMMTISIVMQSDYVSTQSKALHRAIGTLIGLLVSVIIISQSPPHWLTLLLISVVTPFFYAFIRTNYAVAAAGITVFVMLEYQILRHAGLGFILPRLWDTLIGCGLAIIANLILWPQWQSNRLREQIRLTLLSLEQFMEALLCSYASSEADQEDALEKQRLLSYQAQNELVTRYQQALREPMHSGFYLDRVKGIRLVTHTLLNQMTNLALIAKQSVKLPAEQHGELQRAVELGFQSCQHLLEGSDVKWPNTLYEVQLIANHSLPQAKQRQIVYQTRLVIQLLRELFDQIKSLDEHKAAGASPRID